MSRRAAPHSAERTYASGSAVRRGGCGAPRDWLLGRVLGQTWGEGVQGRRLEEGGGGGRRLAGRTEAGERTAGVKVGGRGRDQGRRGAGMQHRASRPWSMALWGVFCNIAFSSSLHLCEQAAASTAAFFGA
jgi:hypothetical protein